MTPLNIEPGARYSTRDQRHIATIVGRNEGVNRAMYPWTVEISPINRASSWKAQVTADGRYFAGQETGFDLVAPIRAAEAPVCVSAGTSVVAGIGDIASTAKGSGARYNGGKTAFELIPLALLAETLELQHGETPAVMALGMLGLFQERDAEARSALLDAIAVIATDDLLGAWAECADVFDFGRKKYAEWNWAKGMPWSVPLACAARHLIAMIKGEALDADSGKSHRGHFVCNVVMLLTYIETYPEGDDRPAVGYLAKVSA